MELQGNNLILSDDEQALTGLSSPLRISDIDVIGLTETSNQIQGELEALASADDDELTHAERGYIVAGGNRLYKRKQAIDAVLNFWMSDTSD